MNEYDTVREYLLTTGQINDIEYITDYGEGYICICRADEGIKEIYFVWLDDLDGWSWTQIFV